MIVLPDGGVFLEKGEVIPYHCPCGWYIQTTETTFTCPHCGNEWDKEDFAGQQFRQMPSN